MWQMPERRRLGTGENITRSGLTAHWDMRRRKSSALPAIEARSINAVTVVYVVVFRCSLRTPISSGPKNGEQANGMATIFGSCKRNRREPCRQQRASGNGSDNAVKVGDRLWAAPRFLVHSLWEFLTRNAQITSRLFDGPPLVASRTELLRRRVVQRAVRSHRIVFPSEPRSLFPGVLHVLELHPLEELVA